MCRGGRWISASDPITIAVVWFVSAVMPFEPECRQALETPSMIVTLLIESKYLDSNLQYFPYGR